MPRVERKETCVVLAELIQTQMDLPDNIVAIYNQRRQLPAQEGLWIDVAVLGERVFGMSNRTHNDPETNDLIEVQGINTQEQIQIDIMSKDSSARLRRVEIIFALTGIAAQQAQERHSLRIANLPTSFVDLSEIEAAARLNRYAITFNVLSFHEMSRRIVPFQFFQIPPAITVNP